MTAHAALFVLACLAASPGGCRNHEDIGARAPGHTRTGTAGHASKGWYRAQRPVFGGILSGFEFHVPAGIDHAVVENRAWAEFERLGAIFDDFSRDGAVFHLNSMAGKGPVRVPEELLDLFAVAMNVRARTNGLFDPMLRPLRLLWRRSEQEGRIPDDREIRNAMDLVDPALVTIDRNAGTMNLVRAGESLDLGGAAKGYIAEAVLRVILDAGADSALAWCGGDLATHGAAPSGGPWTIGVRDPTRPSRTRGRISASGNLRVSTSADYGQPIVIQGRRFSHVFDPGTGRPRTNVDVLAVTVVARPPARGAEVDALATALLLAGPEQGFEILKRFVDAYAVFMVRGPGGGLVDVLSPGMERYYSTGARDGGG